MNVATAKKYRFRLLQGHHVEPKGNPGDDDYELNHIYNARDPKNNLIDTDSDLVTKLGYEKFELVAVDGQLPENYQTPKNRAKEVSDLDELEKMTVAELRQLADDNEIDLGGADRKGDIITTIRQYQAS